MLREPWENDTLDFSPRWWVWTTWLKQVGDYQLHGFLTDVVREQLTTQPSLTQPGTNTEGWKFLMNTGRSIAAAAANNICNTVVCGAYPNKHALNIGSTIKSLSISNITCLFSPCFFTAAFLRAISHGRTILILNTNPSYNETQNFINTTPLN